MILNENNIINFIEKCKEKNIYVVDIKIEHNEITSLKNSPGCLKMNDKNHEIIVKTRKTGF